MNCKKGKEFVQNLMSQMAKRGQNTETEDLEGQKVKAPEKEDAMGAGGEKMRQQMMFEMPLNALVTYGIMADEALEGMIAEMNKK